MAARGSSKRKLAQDEGVDPVEAGSIREILHSMSIDQYDPAVVHQLLEFTHRYTHEVFEESRYYAEYAGRPASEIDLEDVKLAIQTRVNFSFMQPPSRALLSTLVQQKNGRPLPLLKAKTGIRMPPEKYCLTAPNFQFKPRDRPVNKAHGHVVDKAAGEAVQPAPHSKHRASSTPIAVKITTENDGTL